MYQIIMLIHVFAAVFIVALVLVQQGKGATMGAAFGSGASSTVFGSRGSGSFLFRITIGLAIIFFSSSIALNYIATQAYKQEKTMALPFAPQENVPSTPSSNRPSTMPNTEIPNTQTPDTQLPNTQIPNTPADIPVRK